MAIKFQDAATERMVWVERAGALVRIAIASGHELLTVALTPDEAYLLGALLRLPAKEGRDE